MVIPNPWYIDSQARHLATQQRLLAYNAMEGQEGVMMDEHLRVLDTDTPSADVQILPGAYSILARHLGGAYEAYVGKIQEAETVQLNPTDSSGPRTDLIILRVENPYVVGSGSWAQPADALNGPYVHVRVVEGVPANTNHISAYNNTWSAITLARITRPANTGVVLQSHIQDLRSLAKLGEQRIIIIENPPPDPPPIAYQFWSESTPINNSDTLIRTNTSFKNFPNDASWQVPVPDWAKGFDLQVTMNPQVDNHMWGEFRLLMNGNDAGGAIPARFDINFPAGGPGPIRDVILVGGTVSLASGLRGKVINMRLQARSLDAGAHPGVMRVPEGTRVNIWINFKRNPSYNP